jgi:hypothetical protein
MTITLNSSQLRAQQQHLLLNLGFTKVKVPMGLYYYRSYDMNCALKLYYVSAKPPLNALALSHL